MSSNDGGAAIIQGTVNNFLAADFLTSEGERRIEFGQRVRIATDYADAGFGSGDGEQDLTAGDRVSVADDYGASRLVSDAGRRLLVTGDNVTLEDTYGGGGEPGATYRYLGPNARVDLSDENYGDGTRWAKLGGAGGGLYLYNGPDATIDLSATDYGDTTLWTLIAGKAGSVYEYMGETDTLDLSTQDYGDLGLWKPVRETQLIPQANNVTTSDSVAGGGVVVVNDARTAVVAMIEDSIVQAGSVAVTATELAVIRSTADASASSAGGSTFTGQGTSMAVNATIATNRVISSAQAFVRRGSVTTTAGDIRVMALHASVIDAQALSAVTTGSQGVGIVMAFNTIGWKPTNIFFAALDALLGDPLIQGRAFAGEQPAETFAYLQDVTIVSAGAVLVGAFSEMRIDALVSNDATSAPAAFMRAGGMSASASLSSNMVSSAVRASISFAALPAAGDNVVAAGAVEVVAEDQASIHAISSLLASVSPTNDLGQGIINKLAGAMLDDYRFTSRSGTRLVRFGERVRVADDHADADLAGKVFAYMGVDAVRDLAAQDYADFELWKELTPTGLITDSVPYAILSHVGVAIGRDDLTGAAASYFGLIDRNDLRSTVEAFITRAAVNAGGDVTVAAWDDARLLADDSSVIGSWDGYGGLIVTNLVLSSAQASIANGRLTTTDGAGVLVNAENISWLESIATSKIEAWKAISGIAVFNSIGWKPSNILFNAFDALIGDPLASSSFGGEQPARAEAWIVDTPLHVSGDLSVEATSAPVLDATAGNENIADAALDIVFAKKAQAKGLAGGAILASNKVSTAARAFIDFTSGIGVVQVGGAIGVSAQDEAWLVADGTVVQIAIASNTLAGLIDVAKALNLVVIPGDYDFTTASGTRALVSGNRVRVGASYSALLADPGAVYEYTGANASLALGAVNFRAVGAPWRKIVADESNPTDGGLNSLFEGASNLNVTPSDARAVGFLVMLNDLRSSVEAFIDDANVSAAAVDVSADSAAQIVAETEINIVAGGGSFSGLGSVLALGAQAVTNVVLSRASASITDGTVNAGGPVAVTARNRSGIDATLHTSAASAEKAYGFLIAFNSIGWKSQNILFNGIDAFLGDSLIADALGGTRPAETLAHITNATVDAGGALSVTAESSAQLNATISNAADSTASALYNAKGKAAGAILASNKVNSVARAYLQDVVATVTGALAVEASDTAAIYANVKMVSSSVTSNDGGVAVIRNTLNNFVDADFLTSEGERTIEFGQRVRLARDYAEAGIGSDAGLQPLGAGDRVQLADDYGAFRLTNGSGKRLLVTGDNVQVDDDAVYRYLGPNGRVDLADQNYGDTTRWALLGGDAGAVYEYLGPDADLDLSATDYADATLWRLVAGAPGTVYEYMGTTQTLDLGTQDYTDLGYWKPVPDTQLLPSGINVTESDSMAHGGILVLNDVRSDVQAYVRASQLTAAAVTVRALELAFIRASADSSVTSSGGSTFTGQGDSIARNAVIATNVVLSRALALLEDSDVQSGGDVEVSAEGVSQIDATTLNATSSAGQTIALTLAFNSIGWKGQNFLFNAIDAFLGDPLIANAFGAQQPAEVAARIVNSRVDAEGDVDVSAINEALINAEVSNEAAAVAVAFTGAESLSIGVVIASNMVNTTTGASIDYATLPFDYTPGSTPLSLVAGDRVRLADGRVFEYVGIARGPPISLTDATQQYATNPLWRQVNAVVAGGSITVAAEDSAAIDADTSLQALSRSRNDGGLGVITTLLESAQNDYGFTTRSGAQAIKYGDLVRVHEGYALGGVAGAVYSYVGPALAPNATLDLSTANYTTSLWQRIDEDDDDDDSVLTKLGLLDYATNVTASDATGVGALISRNDVRGGAAAVIDHATVAGSELSVSALENAVILATIDSTVTSEGGSIIAGGSSNAINAVIATNLVLSGANASLADSAVTTASGDIAVDAANTSTIDATVSAHTTSKGVSVGVTLAFNSIGWDSQNILFNLADALFGTSIGTERPATTIAAVRRTTLSAAGAIGVTARSAATIAATVETSATAIKATIAEGATSVGVGAVVAMNKVSADVQALIEDTASAVARAGDLAVLASNTASVTSLVDAPSIAVAASADDATGVTVGLSVSRNEIESTMGATIRNVAAATATGGNVLVSTVENATIDATSTASAITVAVSLTSSLAFSGGGATAVNSIKGTANALIASERRHRHRRESGRPHPRHHARHDRDRRHGQGARDRRGREPGHDARRRDRVLARAQLHRLERARRQRPAAGHGHDDRLPPRRRSRDHRLRARAGLHPRRRAGDRGRRGRDRRHRPGAERRRALDRQQGRDDDPRRDRRRDRPVPRRRGRQRLHRRRRDQRHGERQLDDPGGRAGRVGQRHALRQPRAGALDRALPRPQHDQERDQRVDRRRDGEHRRQPRHRRRDPGRVDHRQVGGRRGLRRDLDRLARGRALRRRLGVDEHRAVDRQRLRHQQHARDGGGQGRRGRDHGHRQLHDRGVRAGGRRVRRVRQQHGRRRRPRHRGRAQLHRLEPRSDHGGGEGLHGLRRPPGAQHDRADRLGRDGGRGVPLHRRAGDAQVRLPHIRDPGADQARASRQGRRRRRHRVRVPRRRRPPEPEPRHAGLREHDPMAQGQRARGPGLHEPLDVAAGRPAAVADAGAGVRAELLDRVEPGGGDLRHGLAVDQGDRDRRRHGRRRRRLDRRRPQRRRRLRREPDRNRRQGLHRRRRPVDRRRDAHRHGRGLLAHLRGGRRRLDRHRHRRQRRRGDRHRPLDRVQRGRRRRRRPRQGRRRDDDGRHRDLREVARRDPVRALRRDRAARSTTPPRATRTIPTTPPATRRSCAASRRASRPTATPSPAAGTPPPTCSRPPGRRCRARSTCAPATPSAWSPATAAPASRARCTSTPARTPRESTSEPRPTRTTRSGGRRACG